MENRKSSYVKIINEICAEEGIKLSSYSYDWAFRLQKDEKQAFILGYQFGLNPSSVQQVCNDKNIASEVLKEEFQVFTTPASWHRPCYSTQGEKAVGRHFWLSLKRDLLSARTIMEREAI